MKLLNADCTQIINELPKDNCCVVSDPPFNIGYHYNEYKDNMKESEYLKMLCKLWGGYEAKVIIHYPEILHKLSIEFGEAPLEVITWCYNSNNQRQHRDIAFWGIKPDLNKVKQPYKNPNDKRIAERIKNGSKGARLYDWWEINQVKNISKEKVSHPCQMPLEVMERVIGILPDELTIVDTFMGSGTTGVACKKLNRDFIGIEISKEYFDIAVDRINGANEQMELEI